MRRHQKKKGKKALLGYLAFKPLAPGRCFGGILHLVPLASVDAAEGFQGLGSEDLGFRMFNLRVGA